MAVNLELDQDAAIVIFELLSKHDKDGGSSLALSRAEECALTQLLGCLERKLVEPFSANYPKTLEQARASLLQRFGGDT